MNKKHKVSSSEP